jgi:cephalosporin hydroxylase
MSKITEFNQEVENNIIQLGKDEYLKQLTLSWIQESSRYKYSYLFSFMGRPIIQYPQDMVALQEIIWEVKPDLIIETGIAHGGSIIMSASMLALLDMAEAIESGEKAINPVSSRRKVLGIDIEIRPHNRAAIEAHPMFSRIQMIEGSSIALEVIERVHSIARDYKRILVCLDSMHTHNHVLAELEAYALLVSPGSYCVVFDTLINDMPDDMFHDRPWGKGNNPKTAVHEYLHHLKKEGRTAADGNTLNFEIEKRIENKILITVAPDGYLKRVK